MDMNKMDVSEDKSPLIFETGIIDFTEESNDVVNTSQLSEVSSQQEKKAIPTDNQVVVKIPAPPMEKLQKFANDFAKAAEVSDKFSEQIKQAQNHKQIDVIIKDIIKNRKENFVSNSMSKEEAAKWAEGMVDIVERIYGRAEKFGIKPLDKAFGEKGDLEKLFKSEVAKETVEKIQKQLEKPLEYIEWASMGISLALMFLEGGALISQGSVIKSLANEVAIMEKNLQKMPFGQGRIELEKAINSLKEQLESDKSDFLYDVLSFVVSSAGTVQSITKKTLGTIAKAIAPKLAAALGSKSIALPIVGTSLLAVQKSYEIYRSVSTQLGIKKFHLASQKGEATYEMSKAGTKELFLKQKIEDEDKIFVNKFAGEKNQQLVDTNPYKSAYIIYEAIKDEGIEFKYTGNINIHKKGENNPFMTVNERDSKEKYPQLFDFLKAKAVLDEIENVKSPQKKQQIEKEHSSLLKKHDKIFGDPKLQHQLLEGMKELLGKIKEEKNNDQGIQQLFKSIQMYETKGKTPPEDLYSKLVKVEIEGEKGYGLKSSQLISEGTFRKTYYLTGPTVFGGHPLKIKISKEMYLFLKLEALKVEVKENKDLKKEFDKFTKEYQKVKEDPVKYKELFDNFRALLQNKSARSAFIYNKVEGQFDGELGEIDINIMTIRNDFNGKKDNIFSEQMKKSHLNTAEKVYDHLVNGSYLNDDVVMNKIIQNRPKKELNERELALKKVALSSPMEIDPFRLSMVKGKIYFSLEGKNKIELQVLKNPRNLEDPVNNGHYNNPQALYHFLQSRGNKERFEEKMGKGSFDELNEVLLLDLKTFFDDEKVLNIILHDSALTKIRSGLVTKGLKGQNSILSKRAATENTKIENAKIDLKKILEDKNLNPEQKMEKLRSDGFHLEAFLHYEKGQWILKGLKVEDNNEKREIVDVIIEEKVSISENLAKWISPEKFAEQKSIERMNEKTVTKQSIIDELVEAKKNISKDLPPQVIALKIKKIESAIEDLKKVEWGDSAQDLNRLLNLEVLEEYKNYQSDKYIEDPIGRRGFLLKEALNGSLDEFYNNGDLRIMKAMQNKINIYNVFLGGLQIIEEEKLVNTPLTMSEEDKKNIEKVLENKENRVELAVRKGKGIDTRNTLFRQMIKVMKTEKLRQERVYNAHKARANFVGALGAIAGTVVATLVIGGVIAASASVVGLAVVGFAVLMTAVGLIILKVKKPALFKSLMKAVPFRIAFNNMKKSWNTYQKKKIEIKSKGEVALISVNATPKAEIDKFIQWVKLNDNKLPSWKELSPPMQKMIAGLEGISVARLEEIWDKYNDGGRQRDLLINLIKDHRSPEKARTVAKSPVDDLILEVENWKAKGFPKWENLSEEKQQILAKMMTHKDLTLESLKKVWTGYVNSSQDKENNAGMVSDILNLKKLDLQKKYKAYDKHVSRLERQEQRIIRLKSRNDAAAGNDFAVKLAERMGQKKGATDFNPAEIAWEELVSGGGIEDNELANLLKYEMGVDVEKMFDKKKGLNREVMKDDFIRAFNGFFSLEGQAFVNKMEAFEKKIQSDFAKPLDIVFEYEEVKKK